MEAKQSRQFFRLNYPIGSRPWFRFAKGESKAAVVELSQGGMHLAVQVDAIDLSGFVTGELVLPERTLTLQGRVVRKLRDVVIIAFSKPILITHMMAEQGRVRRSFG